MLHAPGERNGAEKSENQALRSPFNWKPKAMAYIWEISVQKGRLNW